MEKKYQFEASKVKKELIRWISDYFLHNASPDTKAVIGISGGKDSSIVAALCREALGKERVLGVLMPQGEQQDIKISYELCEALEIPYVEINIQNPVEDILREVEKKGLIFNSVAAFNTPARVRMTVLYAVSGIVGGRVANTSNLSEDWVGYATKFGDTAGDFSPLSNLTVTEVKAIGRELGLSQVFVEKTPIDGLCGKTDEENLGFSYGELDLYIREKICKNEAVREKIDGLYKSNLHKIQKLPAFPFSIE